MSKIVKVEDAGKFLKITTEKGTCSAWKVLKNNKPNSAIDLIEEGVDTDLFRFQKNGQYFNIVGVKLEKDTPKQPSGASRKPFKGKNGDVPQEVWIEKERREFRGKCLMYSLSTLERSGWKGTDIDDIIKVVKTIAQKYMDFIYDKIGMGEE
jgi:hypothetical protein